MIKIIITEDNETIREGLALLINATEGMECVGKFGSCEEMLEALPGLKADIFLQDIDLPGISGIEGIPRVLKQYPEAVILMLTIFENEDNIFDALRAGAMGYLLKKMPPAQLIEAIKNAHRGGSPMSPCIARKVVSFFSGKLPRQKKEAIDLSERETEILGSLSAGNSYKMIAEDLFISIDTVRSHIRNIYKKLHVHNQSEAVAKALKSGLIR
jgi:DNA-binding NarL/FixJ family response regulator